MKLHDSTNNIQKLNSTFIFLYPMKWTGNIPLRPMIKFTFYDVMSLKENQRLFCKLLLVSAFWLDTDLALNNTNAFIMYLKFKHINIIFMPIIYISSSKLWQKC